MAPASQETESASPTTTRPDGESSVDNIAQVWRFWHFGAARGGQQRAGHAEGAELLPRPQPLGLLLSLPFIPVECFLQLPIPLPRPRFMLPVLFPSLLLFVLSFPHQPFFSRPVPFVSLWHASWPSTAPIYYNQSGLDPPLRCIGVVVGIDSDNGV
ncbi:hypothetical protein CSHISOI_02793 [Colletotrichum shisoi]|uniref:Uncharacterized protein n=1 Tax=Colletotrichum shisoi TaxID=2078593 RepID=A0A5Q4C257_9PEZI|nr:hypothetical protein CSHISOI_02793 [Colletotrichum shisoi]